MPNQNQNRAPARQAMAERTRVSFGKAYLRDLTQGVQRDVNKQISHAIALGVATPKTAARMKFETLHQKLVEAVQHTPEEKLPKNAPYYALND